MNQQGFIIEVVDKKTAKMIMQRHSACASCGKCTKLSSECQDLVVEVDNSIGAKKGNFWMCCMKDYKTKAEHTIVNDRDEFLRVFNKNRNSIWVGYNIKGYDQWIMKSLIANLDPCVVSDKLIEEHISPWQIDRNLNRIPLYIFELSDSYRSLKELELFMGEDIRESSVPFDLNRYPSKEEIEELTNYCLHDVRMTYKVFEEVYYKYEAQLGLIEYFKLDDSLFNKTESQLSAYILGAKRPNYERNPNWKGRSKTITVCR